MWDVDKIEASALKKYIPVRRHNSSRRPGITSKHILSPEEDDETQWVFETAIPSEYEIKCLLGACLEQAVIAIFSNHIYTFGGRFFKQQKGCPIGYRVTGAVAQMRIADWMIKVKNILSSSKLKVWFETSYVDDVRHLLPILGKGMTWEPSSKRIIFSREQAIQ